jgi:AcrR family transcriptional regulator
MSASLKINVTPAIYLRDPEETDLGRRIVVVGVDLILSDGYESFTFKKLAEQLNSTEASIYRYFESKQHLLMYIFYRYWEGMKINLNIELQKIESGKERLKRLVKFITMPQWHVKDRLIDEQKLVELAQTENIRIHLFNQVDAYNKNGMYIAYKNFVQQLADEILAYKSHYAYAQSLASVLLNSAINQLYYANHLPSLTNIRKGEKAKNELRGFLEHFLFASLK